MKNFILAVIILLAGVCTGEIQAKPQNKNQQIEQNADSLKTKTKGKAKRTKKAKAQTDDVKDQSEEVKAKTKEVKANKENSQKTQCTATTAKGKQCKRMTSSPSGKCWQHEK